MRKMSPALQIVNYKVGNPPQQFQEVIKNLIFMRKHKKFTIEKPILDENTDEKEWYDSDRMKNSHLNYFKTQEQEKEQKEKTNKILLQNNLQQNQIYHSQNQALLKSLTNSLSQNQNSQLQLQIDSIQSPSKVKIPMGMMKKKIIKKVLSTSINKEKEIEVQKKYCKYLLNSLHKSNLFLISKGVPPNLSVLETIDDGDYLPEDQRKEFPHFSNVLQPIDLPPIMKEKVQIIRQPVRFDPRQQAFSVEENTILKVKHIYIFLQKIFEHSIKICQTIREMNFKGDYSLKLQNENHNFEVLAKMIGVNYRVVKLLYDMLNDHYDLEKQLAIGRSDDYKVRVCQQLIELAQKEVRQFYQKRKGSQQNLSYSCYTPVEEYYISLKDLRDIFLQVHRKQK